MTEAHNSKRVPLVTAKNVSIATVVAAVPAFIAANQFYVAWHDARYAKREEVLLIADASDIRNKIDAAQKTADSNSDKLDELTDTLSYIELTSAVGMVTALQDQFDAHMRNATDTPDWQIKRDELKRQLDAAEGFRDCLMENRRNCDSLRRR